MARTLAHRGPDSEGIWFDAAVGIALGHRRLAVVDLSPAGSQPMTSASGRYVVVFNGEIYNFLDLRAELERSGAAPGFRGHSDTEVMLACFERWGVVESTARLNGMFAFAVWDRVQRKLHLARDPLGEKPLYYGWTSHSLLFGSELKSLRAHPEFAGRIDRGALALYLERGYVPAPYSIYQDVFKLPPGTVLTVDAGKREEKVTRFWSFKDAAERGCANPFVGSEEEARRQLERLLADAIKIRMIADVPLGAFLSGGIDSSLVVALMQSISSKPVRTFTIGFHEDSYNEAEAARQVARHLRTEHTEWYITSEEARAVVPRLPALYDEPFADSSQVPTFLVSALARQHVTVSLSGDGGDELFGGYGRYGRISNLRRGLSRLGCQRPVVAGAMGAIARAGAGLPLVPRRLVHRLRRLAALAPLQDPAAFYDAACGYGTAGIVRGAVELSPPRALPEERPRSDNFLAGMMAADTLVYLPDDILVKVDRAAMGVSLESRIPLLDPRVVEFAWTLPDNLKIRGGETKWILRRILYRHVPPKLVERPKRGFAVPVAEWMRGPLREWAEELLDARRIGREGYLEPEPVRRRWSEHLAGRYDHSGALWCALMFQAWLEAGRTPAPAADSLAMEMA